MHTCPRRPCRLESLGPARSHSPAARATNQLGLSSTSCAGLLVISAETKVGGVDIGRQLNGSTLHWLLCQVQHIRMLHRWSPKQPQGRRTSITVPFVITPSCVYEVPLGFFLTPNMPRQKVHFSSGCVTCAFFMRRPAEHTSSKLQPCD